MYQIEAMSQEEIDGQASNEGKNPVAAESAFGPGTVEIFLFSDGPERREKVTCHVLPLPLYSGHGYQRHG